MNENSTAQINERLLNIQKEWLSAVVEPFMAKGYNECFSLPFHFGISGQRDPGRKMIMIVGQEADRFMKYTDTDKNAEYIQQWCIGYFDKQIYKTPFDEYDIYNNSAFWGFFRLLYDEGFDLCWNNVNKLHRYQNIIRNGKTFEATDILTAEYERQLSARYGKEEKSLLRREIEAAKPDGVVFLTGPNYQCTMCTAFGLPEDGLNPYKPVKTNPYNEISGILGLDIPVFWTYHPGYLKRIRCLNSIVEAVSCDFKKYLCNK